ncbi:hypothetical protein [Paracoccus aerodenitrificans]|uniref:hypothetical protein n=1 Tax=Paracoccus aerodenitrificans TaxID=3017781 RepID=UPI0022F0A641|nr:hypothetical protein [Paracoccus aerodenitrificans]WBU64281.1 hypothetical protein PAE61_02165 [Paracoccus aerodenitrificans]
MDSSYTAFHFWSGHRKHLIDEHNFFVSQARQRLFAQFEDEEMKNAADAHAEATWEAMGRHFDPERHDPGDFAEQAYEAGTDLYLSLCDMREQVLFAMLVSIFHRWEKELRDWLVREIRHWMRDETAFRRVWSSSFVEILNLLKDIGLDVRSKPYFKALDGCRLVVNVHKHGDGKSLDDLKRQYPELIASEDEITENGGAALSWKDHSNLHISAEQFEAVSDAIVQFWNDVPECITLGEIKKLPKWLLDAAPSISVK